jgi:hypothetical protein
MSKLREVEARLDAAFARLEVAIVDSQGIGALTGDQAETIESLKAELERIRLERRRDADDVTQILADLRPLLEG